MLKKAVLIIFFIAIAGVSGYFVLNKNQSGDDKIPALISDGVDIASPAPENSDQAKDGFKTFSFNSFHGSTDISDKFTFKYPANWYNSGQYFSPQKVMYYNQFTVKAPIYFDLVLAEVFHLTEIQYQIDKSKRKNPDTTGEIDGKEFKKYDLIDYGTYGGDSAGWVKIFVGPTIKIDGRDYILIFHWEENPLAEYVQGNDVAVFDELMLSLRFFK